MVELFLFATAMGLICAIPKLFGMVVSTLIASAGEWLRGIGKVLSFLKGFIVWLILSPVRFTSDLSKAISLWVGSFSKGYSETSASRKKKAHFNNVMREKKNARTNTRKARSMPSNDELLYRSLAEIKTLREQHQENSSAIERFRAEQVRDLEMMKPACVRMGIFQTDGNGQMIRDEHGSPVKVTVEQMFDQMKSKPSVQPVDNQSNNEATVKVVSQVDSVPANMPSYAELRDGEASFQSAPETMPEQGVVAVGHNENVQDDVVVVPVLEGVPQAMTADPEDIRQPSGKTPTIVNDVPNLAAVI